MTRAFDSILDQQISPQWRGMLAALAAEFETQLGNDELRQLMARVGARFAAAHPLQMCKSTDDLAAALNARWHDMRWGFAELADERDYLRITHYGAPLRAFGAGALTWAPAFLQGCYQGWLRSTGADGLSVVQAGKRDDAFALEFHLGHSAV